MGTGMREVSRMTEPVARIAIAGVSHHTANVMALEAFRFGDEPAFLEAAGEEVPGRPPPPDLQPGRGDCRRRRRGAPGLPCRSGQVRILPHRGPGRPPPPPLACRRHRIDDCRRGPDHRAAQKSAGRRGSSRDCGQFSRALHQQGRPRGNRGAQAHPDQPGGCLGRVCRSAPCRDRTRDA